MANYNEYYRQVSESYDSIRLDLPEDFDFTVSFIAKHARRDACLLDIGCGTGRYGEAFGLCGYSVTGIDMAPSQVEQANKRINAVLGSATALPFDDASFDVCTMIMMIHQLDSDERSAAFSEVHRVLRKDGILIIKTASHDDLSYRISSKFFPDALETDRNRYPDIGQLSRELNLFARVRIVPARIVVKFHMQDMAEKLLQRRTSNLNNLTDSEIENGVKEFYRTYGDQEYVSKVSRYTFFEARKT